MNEEQLFWVDFTPLEGPHLSHLFFCEHILTEVDGVASYIRVVDLWAANGSLPPFNVQPTLSIGLRGMATGSEEEFALLAYAVKDDGGVADHVFSAVIAIPGDTDSVVLNIRPQLSLPRLGMYRFSVVHQGKEFGAVDFEMRAEPIPPDQVRSATLIPHRE